MKQSKLWVKSILVVLTIVIVMLGIVAFISRAQFEEVTEDTGYHISSYDIEIDVDEYRTCTVTENIVAEFESYSSGITRIIPETHTVYRTDGSSTKVEAVVSDFKILYNGHKENRIYSDYRSNGQYVVELGCDNPTIYTVHHYFFTYKYVLGNDAPKGYDEFYYNLIGDNWDTKIYNITFNIELPKNFNYQNNIFGYYGKFGSDSNLKDNVNATFDTNVKDNKVVITGSLNQLNAFEALTVRAEMEDGYFNTTSDTSFVFYLILIGILLVFLLVVIILWRILGKDHELVKPINFYPPNNMDPLDLEVAYKLEAGSKGVTGMIVKLASMGCLKITPVDGDEFVLNAIKEPSSENTNLLNLYRRLFSLSETVSVNDLNDRLSRYLTRDLYAINMKSKVYDDTKAKKAKISSFSILSIITFLFMLLGVIQVGASNDIVFQFCNFVMIGLFAIIVFGGKNKKAIYIYIIALLVAIIFIMYYIALWIKTITLIYVILATTILTITAFIIRYINRRSVKGAEILGEILGFRDFLEYAEKDKLEALVLEDPEYFYNILPYTYVLDLSDKWIEKMNTINIPTPEWYTESGAYFPRLYISVNSATQHVQTQNIINKIHTVSSRIGGSSGGGRSGGGGFSGGGSGGGGGRRR